MLVRLLYASRGVEPINQSVLDSILQQSRAQNAEMGITGVLCAYEDGNGFLQALEGGRSEVNRLYNKIVCDDRHTDVVLLDYAEIHERRFANWRMGRIDLGRVNPSVLLRYCEHPRLDPTSLTARAAMAMLEELTSTLSSA
ncbi:MAG: BLUF domain-containing protein [Gemmatimonadetes bacterium]|jgi:hypothetical protein|nr:BLUF domain-containing protein [Gemmatimonadota bacterium]